MPDPDELFQALTAARMEVHRGDAAVHSTLIAEQLAKRAGSRRRKRIGIGLAAIAITVSTTAAGTGMLALRTGTYGNPHRESESDASEWINVCAPGYGDLVERHQPDGPLPRGTSWAAATRDLVAEAHGSSYCLKGEGSLQQETAIDSGYMFWAQSSWYCAGVDAIHAGDRPGWVAAASQLQRIADSDLMARIDGGGVRDHDAAVAAAIGQGKIPASPDIDCSEVDR